MKNYYTPEELSNLSVAEYAQYRLDRGLDKPTAPGQKPEDSNVINITGLKSSESLHLEIELIAAVTIAANTGDDGCVAYSRGETPCLHYTSKLIYTNTEMLKIVAYSDKIRILCPDAHIGVYPTPAKGNNKAHYDAVITRHEDLKIIFPKILPYVTGKKILNITRLIWQLNEGTSADRYETYRLLKISNARGTKPVKLAKDENEWLRRLDRYTKEMKAKKLALAKD